MSKVSLLYPYRGCGRFDDADDIASQRIVGITEFAGDASSPEAGATTVVSR